MDMIIFSGQSNMQGQTDFCPEKTVVEGAMEYRYLTNELIPLCHPVGEDIGDALLWGAHEGHGSLVPAFCKAYIEGTGRDVIAVHVARGSTQVCEWLPTTERYATLVRKVRGALEACPEKPERVWLAWLQGESDAIFQVTQAEYEAQLREVKNALCRDLPLDGFGIIRVGKFAGDARDLEIIRAQEALGASGEFTLLTRVTGVCTQDAQYLNPYVPGHYNNAGMDLIGTRAGANLARVRREMAPVLEDEPYEDMK